jgi:hypothetical protein
MENTHAINPSTSVVPYDLQGAAHRDTSTCKNSGQNSAWSSSFDSFEYSGENNTSVES